MVNHHQSGVLDQRKVRQGSVKFQLKFLFPAMINSISFSSLQDRVNCEPKAIHKVPNFHPAGRSL